MMEEEKVEDEKSTKLYPILPELVDDVSQQDRSIEEDGGEAFVIDRHRSSPRTRSPIQRSVRSSPLTPSPIQSSVPDSPARETHSQDHQQSQNIWRWVSPIIVVCVTLIIGYFAIPTCTFISRLYLQNNLITIKREWKDIATKLQPHLMARSDRFPSQKEDLWFQIFNGLKGLSNDPKQPAVYLLTYDEHSLHPSSCIVETITTAANNFILERKGWSLLNGSLLTESTIKDPGELIEKIASTLENQKIIVVTDVQNIPAELAQGFHFLVDEFNPKVREAVYVLTLKIPSHLKNSRPVEAAENTLRESWKGLKYDLLMPLITRVTNQVLPVVAENNDISCPLITSVTTEIFI